MSIAYNVIKLNTSKEFRVEIFQKKFAEYFYLRYFDVVCFAKVCDMYVSVNMLFKSSQV